MDSEVATVPDVRERFGVLAVAAAGSAAFAVALAFASTPPAGWERDVAGDLAALPDTLDALLWLVMQAGTRGVAALVVAALVATGRRRAGLVLGVGALVAWLGSVVGKGAIGRPRPTEASLGLALRDSIGGPGFPSSHVAVAAALAVGLVVALRPPTWAIALAGGVVALTALARVYFGAHWPLDVVGGAALGAASSALVAAAVVGRART